MNSTDVIHFTADGVKLCVLSADGTVVPILSECSDCKVTYIVCEFSWYWTTILVRHLFVRWTKLMQSTLSHPMCFKSILILFSHLHLGFRHILLPSDFSIKNLSCRIRATCPAYLDPLIYSHLNNVWWSVQIMKLPFMKFSPVSYHHPLSTLFSNTQA
jgi:hypothetical protein